MNEDTEARYKRQRAEWANMAASKRMTTEGMVNALRPIESDDEPEPRAMPSDEPEDPPWSWWELFLTGIVIAVVLMAVFQLVQVGQ